MFFGFYPVHQLAFPNMLDKHSTEHPVLGQIASIGALDTPDEYFEAVKEEYIKRRDYMIEGLNKIEGV